MINRRVWAGVSAAVLAIATPLILQFEGTVHHGYKDPIGIITACTGHTKTAELNQVYTQEQCDELLAGDLFQHDAEIKSCIKVPVTDYQHAAFLSFAFNVGTGAFCNSTLTRKLNAGDYMGACAELSRWTYAGGRELLGLVRRRAAERATCEGVIQ